MDYHKISRVPSLWDVVTIFVVRQQRPEVFQNLEDWWFGKRGSHLLASDCACMRASEASRLVTETGMNMDEWMDIEQPVRCRGCSTVYCLVGATQSWGAKVVGETLSHLKCWQMRVCWSRCMTGQQTIYICEMLRDVFVGLASMVILCS